MNLCFTLGYFFNYKYIYFCQPTVRVHISRTDVFPGNLDGNLTAKTSMGLLSGIFPGLLFWPDHQSCYKLYTILENALNNEPIYRLQSQTVVESADYFRRKELFSGKCHVNRIIHAVHGSIQNYFTLKTVTILIA